MMQSDAILRDLMVFIIKGHPPYYTKLQSIPFKVFTILQIQCVMKIHDDLFKPLVWTRAL